MGQNSVGGHRYFGMSFLSSCMPGLWEAYRWPLLALPQCLHAAIYPLSHRASPDPHAAPHAGRTGDLYTACYMPAKHTWRDREGGWGGASVKWTYVPTPHLCLPFLLVSSDRCLPHLPRASTCPLPRACTGPTPAPSRLPPLQQHLLPIPPSSTLPTPLCPSFSWTLSSLVSFPDQARHLENRQAFWDGAANRRAGSRHIAYMACRGVHHLLARVT